MEKWLPKSNDMWVLNFPYFGVQADFLFHKLDRHSIYVGGSEMAIKFIHSNNGWMMQNDDDGHF